MSHISEWINELKIKGYSEANAESRVCQDIVLKAISQSPLSRNVTIKGGVVLRSITKNVRRATQDLDIDFIKYPLVDDAIRKFISKLNCLDEVEIIMTGKIEDLKQQDYHGKRVYIKVTDSDSNMITSKIDLGVHKNFQIEQLEYCFDICFQEEAVSLLINSREQILTEKLRSLLKFGAFSTRYKDIFDIYYLSEVVNQNQLRTNLKIYIFNDQGMKENNIDDVLARLRQTFDNKNYRRHLSTTDKNWTDMDIEEVLNTILIFFEKQS
ncbi:MAG: nucleotidyl transferase AbiEii/AbiGii toxin family protein [Clostridiales bacterium]|nr:nucleotidyl transferase AbiEii/AbiGii toxin family protein [Clostridiales bacterium]